MTEYLIKFKLEFDDPEHYLEIFHGVHNSDLGYHYIQMSDFDHAELKGNSVVYCSDSDPSTISDEFSAKVKFFINLNLESVTVVPNPDLIEVLRIGDPPEGVHNITQKTTGDFLVVDRHNNT